MRLSEAKGEPERAETDIRRAVSLNPMWVVSVTELASFLSRQARHDEALQQVKKAIALEPGNVEVITRAVDMAHAALRVHDAAVWLEQLVQLQPNNTRFKNILANDLAYMGRNDEAYALFADALNINPHDATTLQSRARLYWQQGKTGEAAQDMAALYAVQPGVLETAFWYQLTHGQTPSTLPIEMVRSTFDAAAVHFKTQGISEQLHRLPDLMASMITARHTTLEINMLDLGCGTGLLGQRLGRLNGALVGVDISTQMVSQMLGLGLYDKVHTVNVLDALDATPDSLYHVISACDTFPYIGDLSQAVPNAHRILLPGGHLIFSCEIAAEDEADMVLRPSMRFAHKRSAVEALCQSTGFVRVDVMETLLYQDNRDLKGFVVIAEKAV
jgi:predicted TPR repeat methyltransferase